MICETPNKYTWWDVHEACRVEKGIVTEVVETATIPFSTIATAVLTAFEFVHKGMDGLRFKEASFPDSEGYCIFHEMCGFHEVDCLEDWTDYVQGVDAVRAYWATRANNNCAALNGTLFRVLEFLKNKGISKVSVGYAEKLVIEISSLSPRKIGLKPHHVGTIVEPPVTSMVPPSSDGETYHEFLVGLTEDERIPVAFDCSVAQFGLLE